MFVTYIIDTYHRLVSRIADRYARMDRVFDCMRSGGGRFFLDQKPLGEKEEMNMRKKLDGIELAQTIMLESFSEYLKEREFSPVDAVAVFDGRSCIRKAFKKYDIHSNYDIVFKLTPKKIDQHTFLIFTEPLKKYREKLIKTKFAHRKVIPADD